MIAEAHGSGRPRRSARAGAEKPVSTMRRGGGLWRLPDLLKRVLDPAARRRGLAEATLLTDWAAVVGRELAARCHPVKLSGARDRAGGVLVVHVVGSAALELQHAAPQVLDRINGHFGYPAVARLRLVQAPFPRARGRPASRPPPVPSPQEQAEIGRLVAPVGDPELRAALARLGHVLRSGHRRSEADRG